MSGPKAQLNGHQAIIFYGASPGTGKSTLSSFLFAQLHLHDIPVFWIYEDDVVNISCFAEFIVDIQIGNPKMKESLLRATRAYVQECVRTDVVAITDSIYPCINWLIATDLYSHQELRAFGAELEQHLAPLHPLIVFLDADPKIALQRAIDQRGEPWYRELVATLNSYPINREHPLHTVDEVAAYFRVQAALSLDLLQKWSCDLLTIDVVQTPLDLVKSMILRHLGLDELENQPLVIGDELALYVGLFQAKGTVPTTNPLVITLQGETLWVNSYWPNGCPLLVEGDGDFRLENTSHRIHFEKQADGLVVSFTYKIGDSQYTFVKV